MRDFRYLFATDYNLKMYGILGAGWLFPDEQTSLTYKAGAGLEYGFNENISLYVEMPLLQDEFNINNNNKLFKHVEVEEYNNLWFGLKYNI